MLMTVLLIYLMILTHKSSNSLIKSKDLGLLVIPGLGNSIRLSTVSHNLKLLEPYLNNKSTTRLDCIIFIYTPRNDSTFWNTNNIKHFNYITSYCDIFDHPNHRVTENLYTIHPLFINKIYDFVFILLDDCKLLHFQDNKHFPLITALDIMIRNNLTVASPSVIGANVGGGQQFRTIMQREAQDNTLGYVSSFVEIFAWITSPEAYHCLWELLFPSVNPYGWGYDFWYDRYAMDRLMDHKMGIISVIKVKHEQDFSAANNGRTDTASVQTKWQALLDQERFYKDYFGVNLKRYRETVRLVDSSWNASVLGYLY